MEPNRILIHWPSFPGYAAACVRALRAGYPVETLVLCERGGAEYAFDEEAYFGTGRRVDITGEGRRSLRRRVFEFRPSVVMVSGWRRPSRVIAQAAKSAGALVIAASDAIPNGAIRQRLFPLALRGWLSRVFDYFWVTGEKARRHLVASGFPSARIWKGVCCADTDAIGQAAGDRKHTHSGWPKEFLFVGQYIERKGLIELLRAFSGTAFPWRLTLCGRGPLKAAVEAYAHLNPRVSDRGFVQPGALRRVFADAGVFVFPSREDHWGVAVLEAAAAGLPILCSNAAGCVTELLRERQNGFVFPANDPTALRSALEHVAALEDARLEAMGESSRVLAAPHSAARWAASIYQRAFGGHATAHHIDRLL